MEEKNLIGKKKNSFKHKNFVFVKTMSDSKALKEQGNIAYNEDNFDEASKLFKQAIKVEESSMEKDANFLAILNSNLAQTYLEMKK
jgi:hypothetical protein